MTIRGVEPVVAALLERLTASLPGELDTINGEVTDSILVEQPALIADFVPPVGELLQFPAVCIEHGPGSWEDDTGWAATGVYDLAVVAFLQNADQQSLARQLRRYHLAVCRAAVTSTTRGIGTGPGAAWGVVVTGFDFGPALTSRDLERDDPPFTYISWVAVGIRVKIDES